jgi:hypothetical protein
MVKPSFLVLALGGLLATAAASCSSSDSSGDDQASAAGSGQAGSTAGTGGAPLAGQGGQAGKAGTQAGGSSGSTAGSGQAGAAAGGAAGQGPAGGGNAGSGNAGSAGQPQAGAGGEQAGGHAGSGQSGSGQAGGNAGSGPAGQGGGGNAGSGPGKAIQTVFLIMMENHNWADIKGSASAPYLNSLLAEGAHCEGYINPPGNHPSEPNYLWLEAGTNFGIKDDKDPAVNHQGTKLHLATLLQSAGIEWRAYQEDIDGKSCPLTAVNRFAPRHDPFLFFDDVTGGGDPKDPTCIAHNRPYTELAADLTGGKVARYNLITPNLCNDMHDKCAPANDSILQGDSWLAAEVPKILASDAYQQGGALFITWDESEKGDFPIGMIALSPSIKKGYTSTKSYSHSSTLRTMQEIFGVTPLLGAAAAAEDLSELFAAFP